MDVLPLGLTGRGALRAAVVTQREIVRLEGVRVDHLLEFLADAVAVWEPPLVVVPGMEELVRFGGPGSPLVPDLVVCEVAAALGLSQPAATSLVADVLDLGYRLPGTMGALRAGGLGLSRARLIARRTRDLDAGAVLVVDERLSRSVLTGQGWLPLSARVSWGRLQALLEQTIVQVRGDGQRAGALEQARRGRYVQVNPAADGVADLFGRLGAEDAARLDARLEEVARWLRSAGDERGVSELRAVAMGYLADPHLLNELPVPAAAQVSDGATPARPAAQGAAEAGGASCPDRFDPGLRSTVLYLHLDAGSRSWCEERTGALPPEIAEQIVGHSNVSVRPVLDLAGSMTYTGYVAPPRLREQQAMLNAGQCTFPHCGRRARPGEVDHIRPWSRSDPGGPGWAQPGGGTRSSNTQLLCKRHHRAKTHARWRVAKPAPGIWVWRSPANAYYLVTNGTTTELNGALDLPPPPLAAEIDRIDPFFTHTG